MKKIVLLGSTGSIGRQALDVIARHPGRFAVEALVAGRNLDLMREQMTRFRPRSVSVSSREDAARLKEFSNGSCRILWGEEGSLELMKGADYDLALSAIVGAAGLRPTYEALKRGKNVALANKESLVIAGSLMTDCAASTGAKILPVDSEHSALFQAFSCGGAASAKKLILTASGGPFFQKSGEELAHVSVEEALRHPNWDMGSKITIDSATLMNKGLEVIEARWLFQVPVSQIDVVIHPQSIIHSMVEFCDGSIIAQMGTPDMRCAISYALAYPERVESGVKSLRLTEVGNLSFHEPDVSRFPCLRIAREVAEEGGSLPVVLNAANEVAVGLFLEKKIGFLDIPRLVESSLRHHRKRTLGNLDDVFQIDQETRERTRAS
ncbi:MAG: 1-deoxy-D-xylulose-5-phosphate reductoisomerase [Deltaproteobacteria bacterium]|nr:1-deoxy-D-xylulose-5-phosphate reductoisomerase [Deltaproteobacteria bacterium]